MNWNKCSTAIVLTVVCGFVSAQQPIVYPAKGQSPDKQQKDTGECQVWSTQTTGVDPAALAQQSANQPPPPQPQGERVQGAMRGAVGGAILGEVISDDAGKGAAAGAIVGTMRGGARQRQKQQQYAQQQQSQQSQVAGQMDTWNRAFAACMEGRGYVLK